MIIRELLKINAVRLSKARIQSPKLEAEVLLRHALKIDRASFFASLNSNLTASEIEIIDELVRRREKREPLAYIIGHREFYGLEFIVNNHVLIPRQETELLVEKTIEFVSKNRGGNLTVVDVGTGSGAIAVSIAKNVPNVAVYATDISLNALDVARANAEKHNVTEQIKFLQGDLLNGFPGLVDVIVSNPPYVKSGDLCALEPEVQQEPIVALDGGAKGLDVIRRLINQSREHIKPNGCILIEMNPDQISEAKQLVQEVFPSAPVSVHDDLIKLPRAIQIVVNEST